MASFLVFRDLPGVTRDQYAAAQHAAADAARRTTAVNTLADVPATDIIEAIDLRAASSQPPDQADGSGTRRRTP